MHNSLFVLLAQVMFSFSRFFDVASSSYIGFCEVTHSILVDAFLLLKCIN